MLDFSARKGKVPAKRTDVGVQTDTKELLANAFNLATPIPTGHSADSASEKDVTKSPMQSPGKSPARVK